jgi:uncharacterized lipoprotein YddW (UPF0748 family)
MKRFFCIVFILFLSLGSITAQNDEFRGVWISTVFNTDWPSKSGLETAQQQKELSRIFDTHAKNGINAIIFQVRTASDALYDSKLEPWSQWLTGKQGKAPDPYYDPLQFAIDLAHSKGMELHAWLNPYRAEIDTGKHNSARNHIANLHPEWCFSYGRRNYLDPGIPEVQAFIVSVVKDIILRYNVDGIHFDDYFYPYKISGLDFDDDRSFEKYGKSFSRKADWRRSNVDLIVKMLHDTIQYYKPQLKFGISPFGIWRNKKEDVRGSDTRGMTNYDGLYADVLNWVKNGWVDYISPQLYWAIGEKNADFEVLLRWWAANLQQVHFYPGIGVYNTLDAKGLWTDSSQLQRQLALCRTTLGVKGMVFYSSSSFDTNPQQINDFLQNNFFLQPARTPQMPWKQPVAILADVNTNKPIENNLVPNELNKNVSIPAPTTFMVVRSRNNVLMSWEYAATDVLDYQIYRYLDKADARTAVLWKTTTDKYFMFNRRFGFWGRKKYQFYVVAQTSRGKSAMSNTDVLKLRSTISFAN